MKLLNLCCGAVRPTSTDGVEWVNVDNLHATILPGTPERENLDKEANYVNCDVAIGLTPFHDATFDSCIASHCLEHFDCQQGVQVMKDCHRVLKPGGIILVSVPDASYFRKVYDEDTVENAERLFGEPIHLPDGEVTFTGYALWNKFHKAILTEDALWHYFKRAGFDRVLAFTPSSIQERRLQWLRDTESATMVLDHLTQQLNRLPFSLCMCGVKE